MTHNRTALATVAAAFGLDVVLGLWYAAAERLPAWHGVYCALATAVTVGGDVAPDNASGYAAMTLICLTVVPLFGATFSLFTSGLSSVHVRESEKRIKAHIEQHAARGRSTEGGLP